MSAPTVRILTSCNPRKFYTAPATQIPAGYLRIHIQNEGEFFVSPDALRTTPPPLRHPEFPEEVRDIIRQFAGTFATHLPQTLDKWEEGFRQDAHPWREIALWQMFADAYNRFTAHLSGQDEISQEKRAGVFHVSLSIFHHGPPPPGMKYGPQLSLTATRVREIAEWLFSPARHPIQRERRQQLRNLILSPGRLPGPDRVPIHSLSSAGRVEALAFQATALAAIPRGHGLPPPRPALGVLHPPAPGVGDEVP